MSMKSTRVHARSCSTINFVRVVREREAPQVRAAEGLAHRDTGGLELRFDPREHGRVLEPPGVRERRGATPSPHAGPRKPAKRTASAATRARGGAPLRTRRRRTASSSHLWPLAIALAALRVRVATHVLLRHSAQEFGCGCPLVVEQSGRRRSPAVAKPIDISVTTPSNLRPSRRRRATGADAKAGADAAAREALDAAEAVQGARKRRNGVAYLELASAMTGVGDVGPATSSGEKACRARAGPRPRGNARARRPSPRCRRARRARRSHLVKMRKGLTGMHEGAQFGSHSMHQRNPTLWGNRGSAYKRSTGTAFRQSLKLMGVFLSRLSRHSQYPCFRGPPTHASRPRAPRGPID